MGRLRNVARVGVLVGIWFGLQVALPLGLVALNALAPRPERK